MASSKQSLVFGFVVVPNFSLIALSACVDPLRIANNVLGRATYRSVLLSVDGGLVSSSDGIQLMTQHSLAEAPPLDVVFVIGPNPIPSRGLRALTLWLKKMAHQGLPLGGIDTGAYLMAQAGLLDGYRSTIHWEDHEALAEQFPQVIVTQHFFEVDRDRYTCSGGVAPLDLMTYLLTMAPGNRQLANEVANLLVVERRSLTDVQTVSIIHQERVTHPAAVEALRLMEANVSEPLTIAEIAQFAGMPLRSLQRLFRQQFAKSAERIYLDIRLSHARILVQRSDKSIRDIASETGFASPSHLTARYTPRFGAPPQKDRASRQQGLAFKERLLA
ncbi:MAG: GlxA family transcriptional regulator [Rhodoferax sp.]|nr:GlxA family transcriptional regulator [Rhodoferax sp.]